MGKSAFAAIKEALSELPYPKTPRRYEGSEKRYITYYYAFDHGADFGDDEPGCNLVAVQVHFFLPLKENFQGERARIRRLLHQNGFSWPEITVLEEDDTETRHIIFECDYTEEIEEE